MGLEAQGGRKMLTEIAFGLNLISFLINVVFAICTKIKRWTTWYFFLVPALYSFSFILLIILTYK